jgi:hypothetical protein
MRPFTKPRGTRDPELNLDARAQAFLGRIAPLSVPTAARAPWRSRNFAVSAKPKSAGLKPITPSLPSSSTSPSTATPSDKPTLTIWSCVPERCVPASASGDVAQVIYSAAIDGTDRLRYLVGDDSRGFIKARHEMSDQDYVTFMRSHFPPKS